MIRTVKKIYNPRTNADDDYCVMLYYDYGEEWCGPKVEGNRHYEEILKWVADGNVIEEAD